MSDKTLMLSAPLEGETVLFVGEGNFSFSRNLIETHWKNEIAKSDDKTTILSTCFEDNFVSDFAADNAKKLSECGVTVLTGVDATRLDQTEELAKISNSKKFDLIVFMFPHIGGKMKIQKNRQLLKDFASNVSAKLSPNGKVVLALAGGQGGTPFDLVQRREADTWQVVKMMSFGGFELVGVAKFSELSDTDLKASYKSHGYRGWAQGFHTEKGIVHSFKKPLPEIHWYGDATSSDPKDLYIERKRHLLRDQRSIIGQMWFEAMDIFDVENQDKIELVYDQPVKPGLYLYVKPSLDLNTLGIECPVVPYIVVGNCAVDKLEPHYDVQTIAGGRFFRVNVLKSAEAKFHLFATEAARPDCIFSWQYLWKPVVKTSPRIRPAQLDNLSLPDNLSLYPPQYEHCISFWLPGDWQHLELDQLGWGLLVSGNDSVMSCEVMDVYKNSDSRIANTLRIRYKSHLFALSPSLVIELQEKSIGAFLESMGCSLK